MSPPSNKPKSPPLSLAEQAEAAASIGCTLEEIGSLVGLSKRTLIRRCKEDPAFHEAIKRGRAKGRATLRRWQWDAAKSGNVTAQIWLGKQLLGQRSFEREKKEAAKQTAPPLIIETYPAEEEKK